MRKSRFFWTAAPLADGQEYPEDETDVTVTGEFELFEEDRFYYCQLKDAVLNT